MSECISLYHFTDERNIESIRRHGLMCWSLLYVSGIPHIPGSDSLSRTLDLRKGLQNYVRLCLNKNHPMAFVAQKQGRIGSYRWLEIKSDPLYWSTTLFSNRNAAANDAIINSDRRTALESGDVQAEILVFKTIPTCYIKGF